MSQLSIKTELEKVIGDPGEASAILRFIRFYVQDNNLEDTRDFYSNILQRLSAHEPIQYILNTAYFGNLTLYVNNNVLIPRPETEELCDIILKENTLTSAISVLDIGTGSGCIPCMLCTVRQNWQCDAVEVSPEAIKVAQKNIDQLKLDKRVRVIESDILSGNYWKDTYDIIVSNPPYIDISEGQEMEKGVLDWEPHIALFSEGDPLRFYRQLQEIFKDQQKPEVVLYAEINPIFSSQTTEIFNRDFNCRVIKDITGKERFIKVTR